MTEIRSIDDILAAELPPRVMIGRIDHGTGLDHAIRRAKRGTPVLFITSGRPDVLAMRYRSETRETGLPIHVGYLALGATDRDVVTAIAAMIEEYLKKHGCPPEALIVDPIDPVGLSAAELEGVLQRTDIAILVGGPRR
jgi:hypothetical protein